MDTKKTAQTFGKQGSEPFLIRAVPCEAFLSSEALVKEEAKEEA
jgi:hypothetical protein